MSTLGWMSIIVLILLQAGSSLAHDPGVPQEDPVAVAVADTMPGFSWLEPGQLAAMAKPGRQRPLAVDLAFLQTQGIKLLVSLTAEPIPASVLAKYEMAGLHLPVEDFTPPTLAQIDRFLTETAKARKEGYALGIHCTAGKGRTGTMLAAYLVSQGYTAPEAIAEVRRLRPGSVETEEQADRIAEFAQH